MSAAVWVIPLAILLMVLLTPWAVLLVRRYWVWCERKFNGW